MRKVKNILTYLLFILTILYPAGVLATACFGYRFELISISAFAITIAALSVSLVVYDVIYKNVLQNKVIQVLLAIITPLSLVNALFYIFVYPRIWIIASLWISVGCCFYLTIKNSKPIVLKILALVLSVLMALPIGYISFILLIFGNIGRNTVVQTVTSPNGEYYAEVIDSDQGALGGDTFVDVYEKSEINLILFKIKKEHQRVFEGDWGIYKDMQIYWKDNNCLVINAVEYEIE